MSYICKNCGAVFDKPESFLESRPIGCEKFSCCPECHSTEFETAQKCKICDEPCLEDYCDSCKRYVKREFRNFLENTLDDNETQLLYEMIEDGETDYD